MRSALKFARNIERVLRNNATVLKEKKRPRELDTLATDKISRRLICRVVPSVFFYAEEK